MVVCDGEGVALEGGVEVRLDGGRGGVVVCADFDDEECLC